MKRLFYGILTIVLGIGWVIMMVTIHYGEKFLRFLEEKA